MTLNIPTGLVVIYCPLVRASLIKIGLVRRRTLSRYNGSQTLPGFRLGLSFAGTALISLCLRKDHLRLTIHLPAQERTMDGIRDRKSPGRR